MQSRSERSGCARRLTGPAASPTAIGTSRHGIVRLPHRLTIAFVAKESFRADGVGPSRCRQLDRERSELGASKAVVRGGAHGQLLMGERVSWRTPIRSGAHGQADLCFGDGCLPESCTHKMLEFGDEQVRDHARVGTHFRSRACIRSTKSWLFVSASSSAPCRASARDRCRFAWKGAAGTRLHACLSRRRAIERSIRGWRALTRALPST
jgi:hypothetical protein